LFPGNPMNDLCWIGPLLKLPFRRLGVSAIERKEIKISFLSLEFSLYEIIAQTG